jgi:dynein light intermediate chain 1
VLDREAVVVPTGWDSWGKIKVLREGFEPQEMLDLLEERLRGAREQAELGAGDGRDEENVGLEKVCKGMIPELDHAKVCLL